jgi:hypothetical protein
LPRKVRYNVPDALTEQHRAHRPLTVFTASCLLVARTGRAENQAGQVDSKERDARKACLSGDYARGVQILTELFVDSNDPTYIYNQARCYEQSRRCGNAIARFAFVVTVLKQVCTAIGGGCDKWVRTEKTRQQPTSVLDSLLRTR